jgi:hypothetical protein
LKQEGKNREMTFERKVQRQGFSSTLDQYWWQARKEVDKTTRAGLIPSRALQERRIIHERGQSAKETNNESKSKHFPTHCLF